MKKNQPKKISFLFSFLSPALCLSKQSPNNHHQITWKYLHQLNKKKINQTEKSTLLTPPEKKPTKLGCCGPSCSTCGRPRATWRPWSPVAVASIGPPTSNRPGPVPGAAPNWAGLSTGGRRAGPAGCAFARAVASSRPAPRTGFAWCATSKCESGFRVLTTPSSGWRGRRKKHVLLMGQEGERLFFDVLFPDDTHKKAAQYYPFVVVDVVVGVFCSCCWRWCRVFVTSPSSPALTLPWMTRKHCLAKY